MKYLCPVLFLVVIACRTSTSPDDEIDHKTVDCSTVLKDNTYQAADTLPLPISEKDIPKTFEESLSSLDKLLNSKQKAYWRCHTTNEDITAWHFGIGSWLRNNWRLYAETNLPKSLVEMGMLHPDDMSKIILTSYVRQLRGEEMKVKQQIESHRQLWQRKGIDVDSLQTGMMNYE